jgi:S-adenosylmethionine:tRNA ribosyltransferase-isomerase
VISAQL